MTEDLPELTDQQSQLLKAIADGGATTGEISGRLGVTTSTVNYHVRNLREKGLEIKYDRSSKLWYLTDERKPKVERISSKHKTQITREANEVIEAEHSHLLRRLKQSDPLTPDPVVTDNSETFLAVLGDLHFGDVVEGRDGNKYDMSVAEDSVDTFAEKCLQIHDLESETQTLKKCTLALLGDLATGTHIYSGQVHDIEAFLADQVTRSAQKLIDLVVTLAERFEKVEIYGVLGNHGLDRASAARGSNTDLLTYRWMQDALRRMEIPNVEITIADGSHSLTTRVNGQTLHIRHGQEGQRHVDKTAASSRDWRGIWANTRNPLNGDDVGFDIALRGHFHEPSIDWLMNSYPVITSPSMKPGSEFAEKIGHPDVAPPRHLGWCCGVGGSRRLTFKRLVDDGSHH